MTDNSSDTTTRDLLESLAIELSSYQHSLRSPLSVLSGLIEDLLAQRQLSREDFEDAAISLAKLKSQIAALSIPPLPAAQGPTSFSQQALQQSLNQNRSSDTVLEWQIDGELFLADVSTLSHLLLLLAAHGIAPTVRVGPASELMHLRELTSDTPLLASLPRVVRPLVVALGQLIPAYTHPQHEHTLVLVG